MNSRATSVTSLRLYQSAITACLVFWRKNCHPAIWDFYNKIGQKRTNHPRPKSIFVRCYSKSGQTQVRMPTASVTWGGNQDAGDGGIDVRVALAKGKLIQGFVPKRATGLQVKKPDMP